MPDLPPTPTRADLAHELLLYKMQEYSEGLLGATWYQDLEARLWTAMDQQPQIVGSTYLQQLSAELRQLGEIAGGWWVFQDETQPDESGRVFISMERWQQRLRGAGIAPPKAEARPLGLYAGQIQVPEDFNRPMKLVDDDATGMPTSINKPVRAFYRSGRIHVVMESGLELSFPIEGNEKLNGKTDAELNKIEVSPFGLHWPDLDEDLSIQGILEGRYGATRP